ncbi:MerR family DNA-binding transcriptional regulator [Sinorhizobium psoraleae]|uniref:MerR family DNA-binding transcriptional regulator n=1 Tax=Sinorhizobium psoraleae TaxID=520838 RepID=A0ABT4K9Y5_9HYPH|nr:MerR family DNA-binding transcriptional regulator [Sinorhizobium psoraleae]MCZ4088763.1 MerR family DNA-binding transcriptional regulator [Sinorhizobium psoraleae]
MFKRVWDSLIVMIQAATKSRHLTIAEAANLLGVSVSTLRNWDRQGKLKPRRHPINGYRMYDRAEIVGLKEQIEGKV